MDKIYIPQLAKAVDATEAIEFKEFIDGLETLTPAQGVLTVKHLGSCLEVKATGWAIMTLTCDRTLVQFNHRLTIDASELIWLAAPLPVEKHTKEKEIPIDDLVESLPPNGYFDPATWLYEQFCLAIPFPKIAPDAPEVNQSSETTPTIDKRWSALSALQINHLN
ncbi:YceD family protein [Tumidithrix elongata RA019]|uniref:YceD family protein n=1 Tax=Tumidithrix elongata BACA0141 TaxID=2716417 RepID=A0AAW9PVQ5_9CYAN|nr:YceD family protein [Tumidithrix elongata RA019]